jgi:hypothetical protein
VERSWEYINRSQTHKCCWEYINGIFVAVFTYGNKLTAMLWIRTWLQCETGSSVLMTKIVNFTTEKQSSFFLSKIAIYLSLGLHEGRPSYWRSLQPSNKNIQHFKSMTFLYFFSNFVGHLCPPGSDQNQSGSMWIRI